MIGFDTFRCRWDTDAIRIITYYCLALRIIALFSSAELFWYFSKFGREWKGPCGKLRIRYELLRSLRMWYVSLRNERIVADGLYVQSAESVSVCVTGALKIDFNFGHYHTTLLEQLELCTYTHWLIHNSWWQNWRFLSGMALNWICYQKVSTHDPEREAPTRKENFLTSTYYTCKREIGSLSDASRRGPLQYKSGPSSARQRNTILDPPVKRHLNGGSLSGR